MQRWRFPSKVERDLEVVGGDGSVVATLHQIPGGASPLPAPRVKKLTSTARGSGQAVPYGVVPSHMELDLGAAAPTRATALIAELVDGHVAWFSLTPPAPGGGPPTRPRLVRRQGLRRRAEPGHGRHPAALRVDRRQRPPLAVDQGDHRRVRGAGADRAVIVR
ncbi:MAG: hypothetical protein IPH44_26725 [Myxococcales bacterium]|nr:hypothetical protein [Myxococcales bacterium]